jgi:hypothetical protein
MSAFRGKADIVFEAAAISSGISAARSCITAHRASAAGGNAGDLI